MEELIDGMMEYVCDCLCKHREETDQDELDEICCECEMGRYRDELLKRGGKKE